MVKTRELDGNQTTGTKDDDSGDIKGGIPFPLRMECDEEVLSHLIDIKIIYTKEDGLDFSIEYHFSDNEWFSNKVLTMSYFVTCEVNKFDPWSFEGATIHACEGCTIDWKRGKDLTVKTIKKKTKSKGKAQSKTITKQVPNETFFNMFSFTKSSVDKVDSDDTQTQALSDNYNRAEFIRDRLIPKSVLFYTGEALEEDDEDDDEDDFDEELGEDDDGDGGEDYNPQKDLNEAKPPDCKQQ